MKQENETYLGDGLYASHDGYHVVLRAPREPESDHFVFLEPPVLSKFLAYVDSLKRDTPATMIEEV